MRQAALGWGVSSAARYVEDATRRYRRYLHKSAAFGVESVLRDDLAEAWVECQQPNWDGYDALPVSRDALRNMYTFLEALPPGSARPTIGADPHGHLSVEWYRNPRRILSVAVTDDDLLHYAALLGSNSTHGTEVFYDDVPDTILNLVKRVYS
jgi:hypothetical protein